MTVRLTASDVKLHLGGTRCGRRVWIEKTGAAPPKEPGEFEKVLQQLGIEHEEAYAEAAFPDRLNLGGIEPLERRAELTRKAIEAGEEVIYQGALITRVKLGGREVEVVGQPDFMVSTGEGYLIRDAKFARRISEREKPEIIRQLQLYGWLFERVVGSSPAGLEVYTAKEELIEIDRDDPAVLAELEEIFRLSQLQKEPFEVVGWSKCQNCPYTNHCWPRALKAGEPGTIPEVDVGLGERLNELGIERYEAIPERFDTEALADLYRPQGPDREMRRVGPARAAKVLSIIEAHEAWLPLVLARPKIPAFDRYVMFDLEGVPPQRDGSQKVYLWGMQVYPSDGSEPEPPHFPLADFGPDGDRHGWVAFLEVAKSLMDEYGEGIPFVHWASYERDRIEDYIKIYGDPTGLAEKIKEENLLDLLDVTKASVALPLPSYSLKVIEKALGYERRTGLKGDESIAVYLKASSTEEEEVREALMGRLLEYNGEDLEATWLVMEWLRSLPDHGFGPPLPNLPRS